MSGVLRFSCAAFVLLLVSVPVRAQSRPERPYRGLFGSSEAGPGTEWQEALTVSGSLGGGYDTNLAEDAREATSLNLLGPQAARAGSLGQFSASLSYSLANDITRFSAAAGSTGRYYPDDDRILRRDSASLQGSTLIGAGVSVAASATYGPFKVADLYPSIAAPALGQSSDAFDFGSSAEHYFSYSGGLDGAWRLTRRLSLQANYHHGGRPALLELPRQTSHQAGGGLSYNIGRGLDLVLGYRYTQARYGSADPYGNHGINAGVDYRRALSFSRRTTVTFNTGTSAVSNPARERGLQFQAVGDASLSHEIGRTWTASLSYSRNLRFLENWTSPVFSDAVAVSIAGLAHRRFSIHSSAGGSTGRVGAGSGGGFDTYFADAGMSFALGRHAALGTSYRYHHHEFADALSVAPGIPPLLDRHSVQAYVSLWAPIFQRTRRP